MKRALEALRQALQHAWLRTRLSWVESDIHSIEGRIAVAEMELHFLPQQMQAHQDIAADLRTQLAATTRGL